MSRAGALSRGAVVEAGAAVADRAGLGGVSMRAVGKELGVEAMSLYHHVGSKSELLDLLASWVFGQVALTDASLPWREAMVARAVSQREVLSAHPWALGFLESRRSPGEEPLRHHDAALGCLRGQGFPVPLAMNAISALDAYVFGFVLSETSLPFEDPQDAESMISGLSVDPERYPHLTELMSHLTRGVGFDYGDEFSVGLDLVLDGLELRLASKEAL